MDVRVEPNAVVDGDLRASDDDRERVASEIREHFALGRLDADELSTRLGRAYAAETERELEALRADLPRLLPPADATRRGPRAHRYARRAAVLLLPFCASTLVWLLAGAHGSFWPVWVGAASVLHLSRRSLVHRR